MKTWNSLWIFLSVVTWAWGSWSHWAPGCDWSPCTTLHRSSFTGILCLTLPSSSCLRWCSWSTSRSCPLPGRYCFTSGSFLWCVRRSDRWEGAAATHTHCPNIEAEINIHTEVSNCCYTSLQPYGIFMVEDYALHAITDHSPVKLQHYWCLFLNILGPWATSLPPMKMKDEVLQWNRSNEQ